MTTDERLHWLAGYARGLTLLFVSSSRAKAAIQSLDLWAWEREWEQNLAGENPNDPMSARQVAEARAWGLGARASRGVNPPFPVPPYPA